MPEGFGSETKSPSASLRPRDQRVGRDVRQDRSPAKRLHPGSLHYYYY